MARAAFTLTEMLIVVAIIVILAGIGGAILLPQLDKAKEDADRVQAGAIATQATTFRVNHERIPNSAQELTQPVDNMPPLMQPDAVLDRNKEYFIIREGQNGEIIVQSPKPGKDGQMIGNWKKGSQPPQ
jgi:prepilin-type N-terminal cleavage/methylation domain-containing protein